jgi:hypothetical protein
VRLNLLLNFLAGVSISFAESSHPAPPWSFLCPRLQIPSSKKEASLSTKRHIKRLIVAGLFSQYFSFLCYRQGFIVVYFLTPCFFVPHYIDLCVRPATLCQCAVLRVRGSVASSAARHSLNSAITATRSVAADRPLDIPFISSLGP